MPIVAAIQGPVAGGGLGLALCADIVIGSDKAMFRAGYPAIGVSPDLGSSYHVLRRTGPTFAMALFMTNRKVEAIEALTAGLLNEAVPAAALDARIAQLAATLEAMPRASLAAIKRLISAPGQTLPDHMAKEAAEIISCAGTADAIEGITAFSENRPARFG
ncbi:enoyl-CoA hydratase/isomerase family protein [Sulfitobacter porphyrae]|uniref:Enoyl-CoA hydratase/isomerase family protein n=1 Tax=Sulfitobacter porphyrae TaxID=1246864 RepID=A0ABW2B9N4_9RHOB